MTPPRIVTVLASATELVCRLGYQQNLVGRSHECDYPPAIESLPAVSRPKFKHGRTSLEIDKNVKAVLEAGLGVYMVDAEMLEHLQPTHIITQDHCQVCAVSFQDLENAACEVISSHPKIVSLHPRSLDEVWQGFRQVSEALGTPERGEQLLGEIRSRMDEIARTAADLSRPSVAHIEWLSPLMSGGNWMPELIEMAGGKSLFGEAGGRSPKLTWEQILESDPDVLFVCPCGFSIARTLEEIEVLTGKPGWQEMTAVKSNRVYVANGNHYFNRPGPRLAESLEILAEILHPAEFSFGHGEAAWGKLTSNRRV